MSGKVVFLSLLFVIFIGHSSCFTRVDSVNFHPTPYWDVNSYWWGLDRNSLLYLSGVNSGDDVWLMIQGWGDMDDSLEYFDIDIVWPWYSYQFRLLDGILNNDPFTTIYTCDSYPCGLNGYPTPYNHINQNDRVFTGDYNIFPLLSRYYYAWWSGTGLWYYTNNPWFTLASLPYLDDLIATYGPYPRLYVDGWYVDRMYELQFFFSIGRPPRAVGIVGDPHVTTVSSDSFFLADGIWNAVHTEKFAMNVRVEDFVREVVILTEKEIVHLKSIDNQVVVLVNGKSVVLGSKVEVFDGELSYSTTFSDIPMIEGSLPLWWKSEIDLHAHGERVVIRTGFYKKYGTFFEITYLPADIPGLQEKSERSINPRSGILFHETEKKLLSFDETPFQLEHIFVF